MGVQLTTLSGGSAGGMPGDRPTVLESSKNHQGVPRGRSRSASLCRDGGLPGAPLTHLGASGTASHPTRAVAPDRAS
jgi:hypothetical protein